jgi:hypothetical protein
MVMGHDYQCSDKVVNALRDRAHSLMAELRVDRLTLTTDDDQIQVRYVVDGRDAGIAFSSWGLADSADPAMEHMERMIRAHVAKLRREAFAAELTAIALRLRGKGAE